jgi:hypothetical protein
MGGEGDRSGETRGWTDWSVGGMEFRERGDVRRLGCVHTWGSRVCPLGRRGGVVGVLVIAQNTRRSNYDGKRSKYIVDDSTDGIIGGNNVDDSVILCDSDAEDPNDVTSFGDMTSWTRQASSRPV